MEEDNKKAHNRRHAGRKADKKAEKKTNVMDLADKQKNPKAFSYKSIVKAQKNFNRTQNMLHKKHHTPVVDRTPTEPPPILIAVVGGPQSGKTTLINSLIKIYTKQRITSVTGPITVVAGKNRRLTFFEVNNDINCMIDIAKVADLVLILIDITFGIEMEVFEFLEICRAHGTPKIIGVLNHIDMMKDNKVLKKKKKALKNRFQVELYPGAKLFYLTGILKHEYMIHEVKNLSRFISVSKFRPLTFRASHPYVCVDRWEDLTSAEKIRQNCKVDRDLVMYGYVRGTSLQSGQQVHIPGCGDFLLEDVQFLRDPCPLPDHNKKRSLNSEERMLYAPFSGVSGVIYDKDAVYIDLGGSQHGQYIMKKQKEQQLLMQKNTVGERKDNSEGESDEEPEEDAKTVDPEGAVSLMAGLQQLKNASNKEHSIQVFSGGNTIPNSSIQQVHEPRYNNPGLPEFESIVDKKTGRTRRRALIPENRDYSSQQNENDNGEDNDSDSDEEEESNSEIEDENDVHMTEEEIDEPEDSDEDSDVDDVVASLRKNKPKTSCLPPTEPPMKRRRTEPAGGVRPAGNDAFAKIQGVLQSLEEEPSEGEEDLSDGGEGFDDDNGYISCDSEAEREREAMADKDSDEEEDREVKEEDDMDNTDFQRAMFEEAKDAYYKNQSDVKFLMDFIYGDGSAELQLPSSKKEEKKEDEDLSGILKTHEVKLTINDEEDTSFLYTSANKDLSIWKSSEMKQSIKDCFVTGTWKAHEDAETLLKYDDMNENLYGDFEDLTTGEKFGEEEEKEEEEDEVKPATNTAGGRKSAKISKMEKIREKKRKLKEMFESEFEDKSDYFDSWKAVANEQADLNRKEFEALSDDVRVLYEGFRPGMYVRMRFSKMPYEFVVNFDPTYPVIVGGLLESETKFVYNRVRMKVHRWYPKILKNRDPLILSIGWRRIQTMMFYGKREDDLKLRSLKYARKFLHIEALFWGPYAPVGTGFVGFQSVADRVPNFRIAANGVMLEADKTTKLVKKLKLIGHPTSCSQKSAFIQNMFHTETEVSSFIGAKIQTQSGIRGLIKKSAGLKGDFRAKFEDAIKMSDVVILKTWTDVDVAQFCTIVRSLLLSPSEKLHWQGMKTVAQIKRALNIKNQPNPDSLYTEIEKRRTYVPMPLKIPKSLQEKLPYKYKPKHEKKVAVEDRVVIVKDPEEEKADLFMNRTRALFAEQIAKAKEAATLKQKAYRLKKREQDFYRRNREKKAKQEASRKFSQKKKN